MGGVVPSIETFFPSAELVSMCRRRRGRVARTDSDLHLCWPAGRGGKGPGAIEACLHRRSLQRADQLLPKHRVARAMGDGGMLAELFDDEVQGRGSLGLALSDIREAAIGQL
jgi:hypothetical protein